MQTHTPTAQHTIRSITYAVPSATQRGSTYTVSVDPADGRLRCTCPARRQCWHQKAVIAGAAGKPRVRVTLKPVRTVAPSHFSVDDLYPAVA